MPNAFVEKVGRRYLHAIDHFTEGLQSVHQRLAGGSHGLKAFLDFGLHCSHVVGLRSVRIDGSEV
jgi:hypothetical protein